MKKILIAVLLALNTLSLGTAFADTCATNLMPAFTAAQATKLCATLGAVTASLIPSADNTVDLGSASKTFRNLYTGTGINAKTSEILTVRQDANRLFTFDAASDTTETLKWGDGTTAVQKLTISANTADAADDGTLFLAGGGAVGGTRGASITLSGEEVSGGGDATYDVGTADTHIFTVAGATTATIGLNTVVLTGTLTSSATADLGWAAVAGANTACNTTCTSACVVGYDIGTTALVSCSSALADSCLCAGAS